MRLLKCPRSEQLFELVSIPTEMGWFARFRRQSHTMTCRSCRDKMEVIRSKWESYLAPEPEITPSLINVYSRLKTDETLILKGWKLGEFRGGRGPSPRWLADGWLFRGGVGLGVAAVVAILLVSQFKPVEPTVASLNHPQVPYAQIRYEDKNRIQVRYVQPELLESIEFQTSNSGIQAPEAGLGKLR